MAASPPKPGPEDSVRVIVTLTDAASATPAGVEKAAESLRAAGLTVARTMPDLGIVAGAAARTSLQKLRAHPAVRSVEEDQKRRPMG